jgi:hypothetical protein
MMLIKNLGRHSADLAHLSSDGIRGGVAMLEERAAATVSRLVARAEEDANDLPPLVAAARPASPSRSGSSTTTLMEGSAGVRWAVQGVGAHHYRSGGRSELQQGAKTRLASLQRREVSGFDTTSK